MLDDDKLESAVRELIIDICEVMYHRGYQSVPIGAIMRLVGVGEERAQLHDNDFMALDADFEIVLNSRKEPVPPATPDGVTLH